MNPFHYAMRSRQIQLDKQKERDARNQQANNQRIMNQPTDNTGLYGANYKDANVRITKDIARELYKHRELDNAKKEFESELVRLQKKNR